MRLKVLPLTTRLFVPGKLGVRPGVLRGPRSEREWKVDCFFFEKLFFWIPLTSVNHLVNPPRAMSRHIDVKRYPIQDPSTEAYRQLLLDARESLARDGCLRLPGFIDATSVCTMQSECLPLAHQAQSNQNGRRVNCYYTEPDTSLPATHPTNIQFDREFGVIRDDMLPSSAVLRSVYNDPCLMRFIADVLSLPRIYQSRDSYQALTVNIMAEGDHLHWHFDCNACAVTLGIQEPDSGGELEFVPAIGRGNFGPIGSVIAQQPDRPVSSEYKTREGELIFFLGGQSMHRVRAVHGDRLRLVAALQYHRTDDAVDEPEMTERIYGVRVRDHLGPKPPVYADGTQRLNFGRRRRSGSFLLLATMVVATVVLVAHTRRQ